MKQVNFKTEICPEKTFLILAFLFGLLFIFIMPPFQTPDEPNHFYRIYQLSEGIFVGEKTDFGSGGHIPEDLIKMTKDLRGDIPFHKDKKFQIKKLKKYWSVKTNFKNTQFINFKNTVLYSPVMYLPQVTGVSVAKISNFSPLLMIYFGRLFNLFVFIAMGYYAIKFMPVSKWALTLLALMPMTIHQASSLSTDAVCIGLSFLFISLVLNLALTDEKRITGKQVVLIFLAAILLSLCKLNCVLILLSFFLIPANKFKSKKHYLGAFFTIFISCIALILLWNLSLKQIYVPRNVFVNPFEQLMYIVNHPVSFFKNFLSVFGNFHTIHSFFGVLGWLDIPLPKILGGLYLITILLTSLFSYNKNITIKIKQKLIVIFILFINFFLIHLLLYLSFSEAGTQQILGVQGRYFIPASPLLLILLYNNKFQNKIVFLKKYGEAVLVCFIIVTLITAVIFAMKRYYLI